MATSSVGTPVGADDVEQARQRLSAVLSPTPVQRLDRLGARTGGPVWVKREDLQPVRSYKVRGAYNLISRLEQSARDAGVVCASAGNHAQGLAYACGRLGVHGRVYVPRTTPRQKRDRIAVLGGDLVDIRVLGDTYDDAAAEALADASRTGATLVPAFDHPLTVAGQGTAVAEAFEQLEALGEALPDVVVIPVGGGGLLAGTAIWLAERHPEVRLVGVEPAGAACMAAALQAGEPVTLPEVDAFVDGAAVRRAGDVTYPIIRDAKVEVVAVAEGRVCAEMLELYQSDGIIAEPAGALAAAALGDVVRPQPGAAVLVLLSGGNNDVSRYAEVVERALIHEGRKHYFLVDFPQEPGALRRFLDGVLGEDDDITLFEYVKRNNRETGPALVGIELGSPDDLPALLARMQASPPNIEKIPAGSPLFRYLL
ncbi:threonine ammonia-lyase IlvA [Kineosporia sp. J2-2]|uniref:L-threonine dehydratase n=1 Tax=Kineosporia corallincola TaxID=2835133 RepID=A0ABS5T8Y0_9ACTN|nr:threonine ammonia-lyase IlvA [Kineosporia corallincola]MBT0767288.1 threonine ammonia-lyase IlvA [Kineosporia corallincola]